MFPHFYVDYFRHGTHVAGIIGSKTFGVAKKVKIKVVGVAVGANTNASTVRKGLEVVVNDHIKERQKKGYEGSVMNISIAFSASEAVDRAVQAAIDHGIHVAVGAGNDDNDACGWSIARLKDSLCVAAIDFKNVKTSFSNHRPCVDIFASCLKRN